MNSEITLTLKQSTPAFVGYYEPELVDTRYFIRPSSIKGIWRWFSRVLISGGLYDLGYLRGTTKNNLARVTKHEVYAISYLVGKVMGLGYVNVKSVKSESMLEENVSSRFIIKIDVIKSPRVNKVRGSSIIIRGRPIRLQRLGLLTLGRGSLEYFENGLFRLNLVRVRSYDKEGEELAIRTLLLSLTLMGVGKGSRRGLGSLDITEVRGIRIEHDFYKFLENTYELAKKVINKHLEKFKLRPTKPTNLPPLPSISKRSINKLPISAIYKLDNIDWIKVHNFFLRGERCKVIYGDFRILDDLRKNLEAWILGLPRTQRGTGYVIKDRDIERRASPIIVSYHGHNHIFGKGVFITVLLSSDWPQQLSWSNSEERTLKVTQNVIISAIQDAVNELWKYLGISPPNPIWPQVRT